MSSYALTFYSRDDLTFGRDENGSFTVTVNEDAVPETIKIVDNDDGDGGNSFSGSTAAGETGQEAYSGSGGEGFDGDPIQPLAALPGQDNPDQQIMAIGVGSPVHTVGYGFTYEPTPGEPVSFDYDGYDAAPSYDPASLHVEGESHQTESNDEQDGTHASDADHDKEHDKDHDRDHDEDHDDGGSGPSDPHCFTRGTYIRTARGEMRVEELAIGDKLWTESHGLQPIRWICQRKVPARGEFAPIRICAGALGADRDLLVSPAHRMLLQGPEIEVLFGMPKALVAAKDLVNDTDILRDTTRETVEYFHILFDRHEVVQAHGTLSESFFPHGEAVGDFGTEQRAELFALFPELEFGTPSCDLAYPALRAHEIQLVPQYMI